MLFFKNLSSDNIQNALRHKCYINQCPGNIYLLNNSFCFRGEGPLKTSQDLIHFLEVCFIFTSTQSDKIRQDKKRKVRGGWKDSLRRL